MSSGETPLGLDLPGDLAGHEAGLVLLGRCDHHVDPLASGTVRPHPLGLAVRVVGDHRVGRLEDDLRGPVVLLQPHLFRTREGPLEVEDVSHLRPAPRVDALIVVTHRAHVHRIAGQELEKIELRGVGVLELVDEEVAETPEVLLPNVGVLAQQLRREHEEIIEIDRSLCAQAELIEREDFGGDEIVVIAHFLEFGFAGRRGRSSRERSP